MKITVEFSSWDELMEWKGSDRTVVVTGPLSMTLAPDTTAAETASSNAADVMPEPVVETKAAETASAPAETPWDAGTGAVVGATLEEQKQIDAEEKPKEDPEKLRVTCRKILAKLNKAVGGNAAKKLIAEVDPDAENLRTVAADKLPELLKKAEEALNDAG